MKKQIQLTILKRKFSTIYYPRIKFNKSTISRFKILIKFFFKLNIFKFNFSANEIHLKILQLQILFFFKKENKFIALILDRF